MMASNEDNITRTSMKGKGRARPEDIDETTPLLASSSGTHLEDDAPPRRRHLASRLLSVFLFSLAFCIVGLVFLVLVAYSYGSRASDISPEQIQRSVRFWGPDKLDVVKVGRDGSVSLEVRGRVGVDAAAVIGIQDDEDDDIFRYVWKSVGRWGVRQVDRISVNLSEVEVFTTRTHSLLANVSIPPLEISLTVSPPQDDSWLTEVTIPILIVPTKNVSTLLEFIRESWRDGALQMTTETNCAAVHGGGLYEQSWRTRLRAVQTNIRMPIRVKIPAIPGLPPPGRDDPPPDLSTLVTLQSFGIETDVDHHNLRLFANATAVNPLPDSVHYSASEMPFTILLPSINDTAHFIPVASVHTESFNLTHPNISLSITGNVLPLSSNASSTVAVLIANYVSSRDTNISISSPLIPSLSVGAIFPAKRPQPQILRNVTIREMKIVPSSSGSTMLASGTIFARAILPKGIDVGLNVTKVLPDVLIFDGEVPESPQQVVHHDNEVDINLPPPQPLPDPLPDKAFAHIRPDDWLLASSIPIVPDEDSGTSVEVYSKIVDVPLEVLPGRDREFRNFVGKVIFGSQGALAGVQGVAAVAVNVDGLPLRDRDANNELELSGLPFQGSVRVGKKGLYFDSEIS
ncbi:hypothetical protein BDY19DRAFT_943148 [Irpex rosettiformis]|uniref:Uncharacterized protein n=1 Tax=Irpex rosettiformis TaxID=378272 RepID=A0ACB8U624_9APHY|nr:hypothetical protein BDY19DRAFT_943148 [Irpex rosettiformis]